MARQIGYGALTVTDVTDGINNATVYLYQRFASVTGHTPPANNKLTYNFTTGKLTGATADFNGWSQTIPNGDDPLYVVTAVATSIENTYIIPAWNDETRLVVNGEDGTDGIDGTSITAVKEVYYFTTGTAPAQSTLVDGTAIISTSTAAGQWTTVVPAYNVGGKYYTSLQTSLSKGTSPVFSAISLNQALTDANNNAAIAKSIAQANEENAQGALAISQGLESRLKYIWVNLNEPSSLPSDDTLITNDSYYLAGTYAASGIDGTTFNYSKTTTYGWNSLLRHNKLMFRYNGIALTTIGIDGLKLFAPIVSNGVVTGHKLGTEVTATETNIYNPASQKVGMKLNSSGLTLYKYNSTTAAATLNGTGLNIAAGGIKGGSVSELNKFVYASTEDFGSSFTVNNHAATDWRLLVNDKFGVDKAGNLYASGAVISGKVEISSGSTIDPATTVNGTALSTIASNAFNGNTANNKTVTFRGTSTTNSGEATKVVSCTGWTLTDGATIIITWKGNSSLTAGQVNLNINGTGAKPVYIQGVITSDTNRLQWLYGASITFRYNSSGYYEIAEQPPTYYGATCSIPEGTAAKVSVVNQAVVFKGTTVEIPMTNANSASAPTFALKEGDTTTTASYVYYGTSTTVPTKTNGFSWLAGTTVRMVYDGKFWRMGGKTYIDGGNILTDTVTADQIKVNSLSALSANMGTLTTGTIKYGTVGSNDSFYLSRSDTSAKIGGQTSDISGLRLTVGSDFGVTSAGKLYASGAVISGTIEAGSGSNILTSVTSKVQYNLSTSSSSATDDSWQDTVPTWSSGKYIWTRVATTKTTPDGDSIVYSTGVYDKALTDALSTASSAQNTANSAASSVVTTKEYNLSSSTSTANGTWSTTVPTWANGKYIWIRFKIVKTPMSGTATTSYSPSVNGQYDSALTTALSTAADAKTTAYNAAPKSSAIAEEQRIYYRSNSNTKPNGNGLPTAWVTETGNKYNKNATTAAGWSRKITPISTGTSDTTKYLYLWTCIQKKTVNGTVTYGDILLDDSTTVIDGGKIITGSIDANKINVTDLNAFQATIGGWSIDANRIYKYADSTGVTVTSDKAKYYVYIQSNAGTNGGNYAFALRTRTDEQVTANSPVIGSADVLFGVAWNGTMSAKNATIEGVIRAKSGYIGYGATNKIAIGTNTTNASIYSGSHSALNSAVDGFYIGADGIAIGSYNSTSGVTSCPFQVTSAGYLTARYGRIGKFTLSNTYLYSGTGSNQAGMGADTIAFWAGSNTETSAPFRITYQGALTATNATITGTINAHSFAAYDYYNSTYRKRVVVDTAGLKVLDTDEVTEVAKFGSTSIQLGKYSEYHVDINNRGLIIGKQSGSGNGGSLLAYNTSFSLFSELLINITSSVGIQMYGDLDLHGNLAATGLLKSTQYSNTVTIGSQNAGWCHIYNSTSVPFIFNNTVTTTSGNLGTISYPWGTLFMSGHVGKTTAPTPYTQTCNAVWHKASDSTLHTLCQPTSSSMRYKEDVKAIEESSLDPHNLYDIPVVQFKFKEGYLAEDDPYNKDRYDVVGLIAEDVDEHYPVACIKIDGEVENWNERYIIPPMLALIQEQHKEIEMLKAEVKSIKESC